MDSNVYKHCNFQTYLLRLSTDGLPNRDKVYILLASYKFPVFQINRISVLERKPKDTSGQEKSKVVLEKGQGPKEKAHNRRYSGSVKKNGVTE